MSMNRLRPQRPPLGLYVHFPWCVRKCPYCDFNSHARSGPLPQAEYVRQLCADLDSELARLDAEDQRRIDSVFIGGGTPSLIAGEHMARFLAHLEGTGRLSEQAEITLEANPGTVERRYFREYVAAGINRISLGVQSFHETHLKTLGRIHGREDIDRAWDLLTSLPLRQRNLDLMHGLPGQTPEQAAQDLEVATQMAPGHISWYQLTLEPNTEFWRHPPALPADDHLGAIEEAGREILGRAGYQQYEISAWAQPGQECAHNRLYWQFGDYLGIGAGAHGKLTTASGIRRIRRTRQPENYLQAIDFGRQSEPVEPTELPFEYMLNVLRLRDGAPASQFTERTGLPLTHIERPVQRLVQKKMLVSSERHQLTARGWWFYNDAVAEFL